MVCKCERCPGGGGTATSRPGQAVTTDLASGTRNELVEDRHDQRLFHGIPRQHTERFGCEELHGAFLQHRPCPGGDAASVILPLPKGKVFFDFAMEQARRLNARVGFVCDIADQAVAALERARRALPKHRPVSIERAAAGGWGLS
jgi:hypothetical protein